MQTIINNDSIVIHNPSTELLKILKSDLSYTDKSKQYQLKKMSRNPWSRNSPLYKKLQTEVNGVLYSETDNSIEISASFFDAYKEYFVNQIDNRHETGTKIVCPWVTKPYNPRPYQEEAIDLMMCHSRDTQIICFNGSLKKVQDIKVNDILIGPDSKPRKVLKTHSGKGDLYRISPIKGDPFVVNGNHILRLRRSYSSLKRSRKRNNRSQVDSEYIEISVLDYIQQSPAFKHKYKLYRSDCLDWSIDLSQDLEIDPYMLGLWLGDGASDSASISTKDTEIKLELENFASINDLILKQVDSITYRFIAHKRRANNNIFLNKLRKLNLLKNKHIPYHYKISSRENRLQLLAGLLDTDGSLIDSSVFDFTQKNKSIADDVVFIARSLGLAAYIKPSYKRATNSVTHENSLYWRVQISGNTDIIPTRIRRKQAISRKQIKNPLNVGFTVEPIGKGEYYGFEVDSDHLYLISDFTVTHNCNYRGVINFATGLGKTLIATHFIQRYKKKALVICPSDSVAKQFYTQFVDCFGKNKVGFFGGGKKKINDITVAIAASATRNIQELKDANFGVVIFDEVHHTPASTFFDIAKGLASVGKIFGLTATDYRSDGKDIMMTAGCGSVLIRRDIKWGVENGFLAEPYFIVREIKTGGKDYKDDKLRSYKEHILNSSIMKSRIESDARSMMSAGKSVLILVDEVAHGTELAKNLNIPFATGEDKNSQAYVDQLNSGKIPGLIGTDGKISEGTDTKNVDVLILANFVASKGPVMQCIGRALRKQGAKSKALILDYIPIDSTILSRHSKKRISYYEEITCKVKIVAMTDAQD